MIPELAISVLACARIGAIHSVVFAGFSYVFKVENFNSDSFLGGVVSGLILLGILRGAFSNEAVMYSSYGSWCSKN